MDFFKSVFSDDLENSDSQSSTTSSSPESQPQQDSKPSSSTTNPNPNSTPNVSSITNAWTFGSRFIKTLASRSESVIETYRRDLEEFGSGLRKETAVIRNVATRAVKDLPAAAQGSLESVGQAIDGLGNTVTEIVTHGKESILAGDSDSEASDTTQIGIDQQNLNSISEPHSRFDSQIRTIQCDMNTYCEEPEDLDEYTEWKLGFVLDERSEEIEENGVIQEIYNEIVPSTVDHDTFWTRYFYRIYKVKEAEKARSKLVKRAISGEEEEELTWDVDDDDYEGSGESKSKGDSKGQAEQKHSLEKNVETGEGLKRENDDRDGVSESKSVSEIDQQGTLEGRLDEPESSCDKLEGKLDEKTSAEGKTDSGGSSKDSDFSVVSSQPTPEEEDIGWDEIEDIGSSDEIKVDVLGSANRADLHRRLSAAEEEEDLTWDIEDDDEPVRS